MNISHYIRFNSDFLMMIIGYITITDYKILLFSIPEVYHYHRRNKRYILYKLLASTGLSPEIENCETVLIQFKRASPLFKLDRALLYVSIQMDYSDLVKAISLKPMFISEFDNAAVFASYSGSDECLMYYIYIHKTLGLYININNALRFACRSFRIRCVQILLGNFRFHQLVIFECLNSIDRSYEKNNNQKIVKRLILCYIDLFFVRQ